MLLTMSTVAGQKPHIMCLPNLEHMLSVSRLSHLCSRKCSRLESARSLEMHSGKHCFPSLGMLISHACCKVLWACVNECGYEDLVDCFTRDVKFGISMAWIHCRLSSADVMHHLQLTQRLSELWGKAKKAASGKPGSYYQLNIIEQPQDRQKSVVELLDQMAYIYPTNVVCVCDSWFFLTNNYFLRVGTWWWTDHISTQPSLLLSRISSLKVHEVHMPKSISIGSCQVPKRVQGRMN